MNVSNKLWIRINLTLHDHVFYVNNIYSDFSIQASGHIKCDRRQFSPMCNRRLQKVYISQKSLVGLFDDKRSNKYMNCFRLTAKLQLRKSQVCENI